MPDRPPPHQGALVPVSGVTGICVHPFLANFFFILYSPSFQQSSTVLPPYCCSFSIALVGSLAMVGTGVYSMLVAKIYNRIGPFKTAIMGTLISMAALLVTSRGTGIYFMMASYGIVFGIGSCFVFLPLYLTMPRYFRKRRSLALGLVATGPGGGLFIMSPVMQALIDALDWRGTFMAMAGIVAIIGPLVCVFLRIPDDRTEDHDAPDGNKGKLFDFSVFRNKRFVIFTVAMCLMYAGHYIPSVHMVSHKLTCDQGAFFF